MIDLEWVRGFRLGLWYVDMNDWDDDDTDWNFAFCFDLGFFQIIIYTNPRDTDVDDLI
jgi:hypothetical protein